MPDRVNAAVDAVQVAGIDASADRARGQSGRQQLVERDYALLPGGDDGCPRIWADDLLPHVGNKSSSAVDAP